MPPLQQIPYGLPPAWCVPVTEVCMYVLFLLCVAHAVRQGLSHVGYLMGGLVFGLILEYVNVHAHLNYTYGRFLVMFGDAPLDIPLCIGLGWGAIMYTARLFSDALGLPLWSAIALDALLAINVDLSMDAVAYRLHLWHWDWTQQQLDPLTADWFGVPYGNFFGWLLVVFFYSAFSRLLERRLAGRNIALTLLVPVLAIILSEIALYAMLLHVDKWLYDWLGIKSVHRFVAFSMVLLYMVASGFRRRRFEDRKPMPFITWLIPVWFHLFFFVWLFAGGFYTESTTLVVVSVLNLVVGLAVHGLALRPGRNAAAQTALQLSRKRRKIVIPR